LRAALLAVDGDPLDQIGDVEHVKLVICNGNVAADPTAIATSSRSPRPDLPYQVEAAGFASQT
jgi:hypothetical protein